MTEIRAFLKTDRLKIYKFDDRLKLKQILTNLLNNAFKFTQTGEIRFQAIPRTKSLIEISVSDTRIGIEPEKQVDIFDAFI